MRVRPVALSLDHDDMVLSVEDVVRKDCIGSVSERLDRSRQHK